METPKLVFVPQPPRDEYGNITGPVTGGGAAGFAVMDGGVIIDVVLTNSGSDYAAPPKVLITRGYEIYRNPDRVIESRTDLILKPFIKQLFSVSSQFIINLGNKTTPDHSAIITTIAKYDSTNPTIIVTPPVRVATISENKKQLTAIINAEVGAANTITRVEYNRISTITQPINVESSSTVTKVTTVFADFGACDVYSSGVDEDKYEFAQLGNRFSVYENIKFSQDLGLASYAGQPVSQQNTLQEMEIYYPTVTIGDFADRSESSLSANGANWKLTWPTINEYGGILDSALSATDTTVYIPDTSRFPSSGKLMIGDEVVQYSSKTSDRFYGVLRGFNNNIGAWDLSKTPNNLGGGTSFTIFDVSNEETANGPNDIYFSPDGEYMYIVGTQSDSVHQYTLSTAWDITTATVTNSFSVISEEFNPQGLYLSPTGHKMYIGGSSSVSNSDKRVFEYDLATSWDVSTASYSGNSLVTDPITSPIPAQVYLKSNGTTMFIMGSGGTSADAIFQYTLSTPWDLSTASYDNISFNVNSEDTNPQGISFHPNGTKFFMEGRSGRSVYEYEMSTPWDITTASYTSVSLYTGSANQIANGDVAIPTGVYVQPEGNKLFVIDVNVAEVQEHNMSAGKTHNAGDYLRSLV